MQAERNTTKVHMSVMRRPYVSEITLAVRISRGTGAIIWYGRQTHAQRVGEIAWKIMYVVTVRLMFSTDVCSAEAMVGIAGK